MCVWLISLGAVVSRLVPGGTGVGTSLLLTPPRAHRLQGAHPCVVGGRAGCFQLLPTVRLPRAGPASNRSGRGLGVEPRVRTWAFRWLCGNCQTISHSSYAPQHGRGLRVTACPRSGFLCVCVAATALTGTSAVICDAEHLLGVLAVCASSLEKHVKGPSPSSGRALPAAGLYSSLRPWFPDPEPLRFPGVACHSTGCLSASLATSLMRNLSLW